VLGADNGTVACDCIADWVDETFGVRAGR